MSEIWGQIVLPGMFEEGLMRECHVPEAWKLGGTFEGLRIATALAYLGDNVGLWSLDSLWII